MIYPTVPFSVTLTEISSSWVIRPTDGVDVLCAQLTRDLFAIGKVLSEFAEGSYCRGCRYNSNISTITSSCRSNNV